MEMNVGLFQSVLYVSRSQHCQAEQVPVFWSEQWALEETPGKAEVTRKLSGFLGAQQECAGATPLLEMFEI